MAGSPPPIADLSQLDPLVSNVRRAAAEPGARVWISGPPGSGRTTVARRLAESDDSVLVEPPDAFEADAIGHAAVQMAVQVGAPIPDEIASLALLRNTLKAAAEANRLLILRLPGSWSRSLLSIPSDPDDQALRLRVREFVRVVDRASAVRLILVAEKLPERLRRRYVRIVAPAVPARLEALTDPDLWGTYAPAADRLRRALSAGLTPNPLALRLSVGAAMLGTPVDDLSERLKWDDRNLGALVDRLAVAATRRGLADILQRFRLVRHALPVKDVLAALEIPAEHAPLVTSCLAYVDDGLVRFPDAVRAHLRSSLDRLGMPRAKAADSRHLALAEAHERWDGVDDVRTAAPDRVTHALERAHQLANAGSLGEEAWDRLRWLPVEALIDRARDLSLQHRYAEAAELYERCIGIDPSSDYAQHYLGFNLDRVGGDPAAAEGPYRAAVKLNRTNAWWNARLVTFLIGQSRFQEATEAYAAARQSSADPRRPEGQRMFAEVAYWAASAWLARGEIARARAAYDDIPLGVPDRAGLAALENRLVDAEEVARLGRSVRPASLEANRRWTRCQLPATLQGVPLTQWFGGRVAEVLDDEVRLVLAEPPGERVFLKRLSDTQWSALTNIPASDVLGRYVEVGDFGDTTLLVLLRLEDPPPADLAHELRHLRDWEGRTP